MNRPPVHLALALGVLAAALPGGGEARGATTIFEYDFEDGATNVDLMLGAFSQVQVAAGQGVGGSQALQLTEGLGNFEVLWNLNPDGSAVTGEVLHISYDHRMDSGGFNIPYLMPLYGDVSTAGTTDYRQYTAIGHRPRTNGDDVSYEARFGVDLNKVNITDPSDPIPNDGTFHRVDIYLPLLDLLDPPLPDPPPDPLPDPPTRAGFGRVQAVGQDVTYGATNFFTVNGPQDPDDPDEPNPIYTQREVRSLQWFSSGFGFGLNSYLDNFRVATLDVSDIDAVLADVNGTPTDLASDFTYDFAEPSLNGVVDTNDRDRFIEDIMVSFLGDYNLDRQVDLTDLQTLADNFEQNVGSYAQGDTNGTGFVDLDDVLLIGQNWHRDNDPDSPVAGPTSFADALALVGLPPIGNGLAGDYNGSGVVEQGDLNLVLNNWGTDILAGGVPSSWVNDLPAGIVDQEELNGVLNNWGDSLAPAFTVSGVPEPTAFALVPLVVLAHRRSSSRKAHAWFGRRRASRLDPHSTVKN